MCEAATRNLKSWWTIDNGYCLPYSLAYQTMQIDSTASTSNCTFSLKCALSGGLDRDCECQNATACGSMVTKLCVNPGPAISRTNPIPRSLRLYAI